MYRLKGFSEKGPASFNTFNTPVLQREKKLLHLNYCAFAMKLLNQRGFCTFSGIALITMNLK